MGPQLLVHVCIGRACVCISVCVSVQVGQCERECASGTVCACMQVGLCVCECASGTV
jgi:hypothetical protein